MRGHGGREARMIAVRHQDPSSGVFDSDHRIGWVEGVGGRVARGGAGMGEPVDWARSKVEIAGRMAIFLLPGPETMKTRLICPLAPAPSRA
jgi:hypothetical protein